MSEKKFRTATITVKGSPVETITRDPGETFKEFVKKAETAARHNKGRVAEDYKGKTDEDAK